MTLSCNCDMPIEIYCDWLQDQGWDCEEMRSDEEVVIDYETYTRGVPYPYICKGSGLRYLRGNGDHYGEGTGDAFHDGWGCIFSYGDTSD